MRSRTPTDPKVLAYRRAVSAAVVGHARYLAVQGEKNVTQHLVDRRRAEWQQMEARRARLGAHLQEGTQQALLTRHQPNA